MQLRLLEVNDFIDSYRKSNAVLLDARSTGEYEKAHIPGAVSLPLLDNESRAIIGTAYKQQGREAAVLKGFELEGPRFHEKILRALTLAPDKQVYIYCWRGGMRSNILAWLLQMAGFRVTLLKGGYKTFRHWIINHYKTPRNYLVLGGKTGSGKTEMLYLLKQAGEQIVDLEGLAHHKGSTYGALGQLPQYSQEHFENLLGWQLSTLSTSQRIWIENESRLIGKNCLPPDFYDLQIRSPKISVEVDVEVRIKRITNEYACFPVDALIERTIAVKNRMGPQHSKMAVEYLQAGDFQSWITKMLEYYDKTYTHSSDQQPNCVNTPVPFNWDDKEVSVRKLINRANEIAK